MATYAIGDVHGCFSTLERLLQQIQFNPKNDRLWFAGDLVNRGPQSLEVLRFVKSLGNVAHLVLGNHEIYLLTLFAGVGEHLRDRDSGIEAVLKAPDCQALCDWLRQQPFLYEEADTPYLMVHAGVPIQWDLEQARACAEELATCMRSPHYASFLDGFEHYLLHRDKKRRYVWSDQLKGQARLNFICDALTRIRFCDAEGGLDFLHNGAPGSQPAYLVPWFDHPKRCSYSLHIIHGHWSTLRTDTPRPNIYSIDGGCVWGSNLIAFCLETQAYVLA